MARAATAIAKYHKAVAVQLLILVEVIICSGGFWSACWSDVIAKMVAIPVSNAAFERRVSAKSGHPYQLENGHTSPTFNGFKLNEAAVTMLRGLSTLLVMTCAQRRLTGSSFS